MVCRLVNVTRRRAEPKGDRGTMPPGGSGDVESSSYNLVYSGLAVQVIKLDSEVMIAWHAGTVLNPHGFYSHTRTFIPRLHDKLDLTTLAGFQTDKFFGDGRQALLVVLMTVQSVGYTFQMLQKKRHILRLFEPAPAGVTPPIGEFDDATRCSAGRRCSAAAGLPCQPGLL